MSELKRIVSKVNPNCTYTNTANYWAPLSDEEDDDRCEGVAPIEQAINNISAADVQRDLRSTILAWIYQRMGKHKPFQWKASTVVVDSGATSSFVMLEENLPITGPSNKVVALPDGATKQATHTAILPFESLSDEARKADVLPGLRPNSLVSVSKFADADYTTYSIHEEKASPCIKRRENSSNILTFTKTLFRRFRHFVK